MEESKLNRISWGIADVLLACYVAAELLYEHSKVSQLFLALFCLSVIWVMIRNSRYFLELFFFCYGGLIIWGTVCAFAGWTIDRDVALDMIRTMIIDLVYLFLLYQYLVLRSDLVIPMRVLQIAAFMAFIGIVIITWPEVLTDRIGRQHGYMPNVISTLMETGFIFSVYLFFEKKKWYDAAATCCFFGMILLTGSRRGMAVAVLFAVFAILWHNREHLLRTVLILVGAGAAVCILCFAVPKLKVLVWDRMAKAVRMVLGTGKDASANSRLFFLRESVPLIKDRPLTGLGMNCFYLVEAKRNTYSHNNYLELLLSGGIPALILFYVPVVHMFVRGIRRIKESSGARLALYLLFRLLITGIMVVSYYERQELFLVVFAMALLRKVEGGTGIPLLKRKKRGIS
ncbi:MAG: O-antigen ligase family protein [Clostridiales bacterium]|nr:O-antigen ligase family protein [Clostridiales bacterium]